MQYLSWLVQSWMAYYKIGVLYQKQAREDEKQQEGDKKTHDLSDKLKVFSYQVL